MDKPTIDIGDDIILKGALATAMTRISSALLTDCDIEVSRIAGYTANQLVVQLRKMLYVNPLGRMVVEYPATPWEHFRADHFPKTRLGRWFLKRKPVRMHCEVRSAAVAFPESTMRVYPTSLGHPVYVTRVSPPFGDEE